MAARPAIAARRAEVRDLYDSGVPLADIAERLNVNITTVMRDVWVLANRGQVTWRNARHPARR